MATEAATTSNAFAQQPRNTDNDVTIQDGYFTASDGVRIHYVVAGEGEPVILIHGITGSVETWLDKGNLLPQLMRHYRVIAIDLRGHGKSDKPHDPKQYGPQMAQDVIELMDNLKLKKAHFHGFSLGCAITGMVLVAHPERVATVALAGWSLRWETAPEWKARVPKEPEGEDPVERKIWDAVPHRKDVDLKATNAVWKYPWDPRDGMFMRLRLDLTRIRIPVLSIVGEYDFPNAHTHRLKRELPNFRRVVIAGKAHLTMVGIGVDANGSIVNGPLPELYLRSVLGFLKEHPIE